MEKEATCDCIPTESFEKDYFLNNKEIFFLTSKLLKESQPEKVLDIGIYTALIYKELTPELLKKGSIYGIDINQNYLKVASERGVITKRCNLDKEKIPFDDNFFDVVLCDSLLEHTLNPKGLLEEISRVLKKNGKLILCVPSATSSVRRWDMLRGRSPFHSIIDNLFNKSYMKRCAVLYSPEDLDWAMGKNFKKRREFYIDKKKDDPKTVSIFVCRLFSKLFPRMRDMIIVEAFKT